VSPGIAPLCDRIGARLGLIALGRIEARDSHIPERASVLTTIAAEPPPQPSPAGGGGRPPRGRGGAAVSAQPPRPLRLFAPPPPPACLSPAAPPFRFTWRRRAYRVSRAEGPERIAEEWWCEEGGVFGAAIRDYYRIEDEAGRRFWLVRAGLSGDPPPRWFVHG